MFVSSLRDSLKEKELSEDVKVRRQRYKMDIKDNWPLLHSDNQ